MTYERISSQDLRVYKLYKGGSYEQKLSLRKFSKLGVWLLTCFVAGAAWGKTLKTLAQVPAIVSATRDDVNFFEAWLPDVAANDTPAIGS